MFHALGSMLLLGMMTFLIPSGLVLMAYALLLVPTRSISMTSDGYMPFPTRTTAGTRRTTSSGFSVTMPSPDAAPSRIGMLPTMDTYAKTRSFGSTPPLLFFTAIGVGLGGSAPPSITRWKPLCPRTTRPRFTARAKMRSLLGILPRLLAISGSKLGTDLA